MDHCPGCSPRHLDMTEAMMAVLCGVDFDRGETCDYLDGLVVTVLGGEKGDG